MISQSPVRRSARLASKPAPKYFDEDDFIYDTIEQYCTKYDWEFSDNFVAEFNAWRHTVHKYALEKYDSKTGTYVPRTTAEAANYWTRYCCNSTLEQQKAQKLIRTIDKYCQKNGFEYCPLMVQKFTKWMADPANKKHITITYRSQYEPNGYTYYRNTNQCINKWFSTLKKTVVL
jgi:hypothetical protein